MIAVNITKITDQPGMVDHIEVRLTTYKTTQVKVSRNGKRTQIRVEPVEDKIFAFNEETPEAYAMAFLTIANYRSEE